MYRLTVHLYGETKKTDHETLATAHHALVVSAYNSGYDLRFDRDPIKGHISGTFNYRRNYGEYRERGSFSIGKLNTKGESDERLR